MKRLVLGMLLMCGVAQAERMTVDADSFEVDRAAKQGVFAGHVVVVRPDMTLRCDRLEGDFGKTLSTLVATGNVNISRAGADAVTATGARAEYNPASGGVVMTGGVTLTQGGHTLVGDRLDYDVKAGKARLTSTNRVRATLGNEDTSGSTVP